jgi:arabinogalactan oligomer / maltooligosaccharide transport system substrate-binding protein
MKSRTRIIALFAGVAATLAAVAGSASAAPAKGTAPEATRSIRIWTDVDRKAAVDRIASAWGRSRGIEVEVVEKGFGDIRDGVRTAQAANGPDVIVGAHDWTGQLAADGLILPLFPRATVRAQFPAYALEAFSYGTAVKRLYAAPVAIENIGLVVNTRLAHVPRNFADFQRQALAFKRRGGGRLALALPQAPAGDAYHMYPFFSGLGGYVFGKNRAGNLDPSDIGVANPRFIRNAGLIDTWNRLGLINSKIDYNTAKNAFLQRRAAFWITGPWEADTLKKSGLRFRIVQLPKIKYRSVPFLGVQGFMVTRFAAVHGVESLAKDLVGAYMMTPAAQTALAAANGRFPANRQAGRAVRDNVLAQFGRAGTGGVPMPNIPQMSSVWTELGGAWVKSTRGRGAVKARVAFRTAARNIANKIG